jgi:glycosyltransferase involved in cell wall biosynthesis
MEYSVVVPAYNEADNIKPLFYSLSGVLDSLTADWEIIMVDDASDDGTSAELSDIKSYDDRVKVCRLKQRMGQSKALEAGFRMSNGEIVIQLDADLQNDPLDIPSLLAKLGVEYMSFCPFLVHEFMSSF